MKCKLVSATDKKTNKERLIHGERIDAIGKTGNLEMIGDITDDGSMFLFVCDVTCRYLRTSRGKWKEDGNRFIVDTYNSIYEFEVIKENEKM